MKNKLIILLAILIYATGQAQAQFVVAENWTQTDCDGVDHNLYNTLDTGTVVVMEIVMLGGCMPCINTAHLIGPIIDTYNETYENRIHYYTFGFDDSYPCVDLLEWKTTNEITSNASFVEGAAIADYYGGMGMPTIVVVGRTNHIAYFNQFGFVTGDTLEFEMALLYALGIVEPVNINTNSVNEMSCSPNPANTFLTINNASPDAQYFIYAINGELVFTVANLYENTINIEALNSGIYILKCIANGETVATQFVKS